MSRDKSSATKYIIFAIIGIFIIVILYGIPRNYDKVIEGVRFQLGDGNESKYEEVNIEFHGDYTRRFFSGDKFRGNIEIGDDKIEFVELNFHKSNRYVIFGLVEEEKEYNNYGVIYTEGNLDEFTIIILRGEGEFGTWSRENGIMVSAPAKNRKDGIEISNKMMEPYLIDSRFK